MPTLLQHVESTVLHAIQAAFPGLTDVQPLVTPATDARFGDYQSNVAMGLKKRMPEKNPRDIAQAIVAQLQGSDMVEAPEIAGPGFINMRLKPAWVTARLQAIYADDRVGVEKASPARTYVVDFSSPNVAKPMHVGHIRSTIIGACLARVLEFAGHKVITDNHIGDWGTQFGFVIYGYRHFLNRDAYEKDPIEELVRVYKLANDASKTDEKVRETARNELVALQREDGENRRLWREFIAVSMREFDKVYTRLGVKFDHVLGESFYNDMLAAVVEDLKAKGIATQDAGAWCVFIDEPQMPKAPFIVQKSDGAFNYASTDLATIRYRAEHFKADAALYVVGAPQADHFKQLFHTARRWGYANLELRHIEFGSVLGEDGKILRTRGSDNVRLQDLLDEAEERALKIVQELRPDLDAATQKEIASAVGIGAVKYADLLQNRSTDYKFSMDKMVALEGNTAPYLMMQYVRARSIFRKAGEDPTAFRARGGTFRMEHPSELALARHILRLPDAIRATLTEYRPNLMCGYLYELAEKYSAFFRDCHVVTSEGETRVSRLMLCDQFARTLRTGLDLLSIRTVEQM